MLNRFTDRFLRLVAENKELRNENEILRNIDLQLRPIRWRVLLNQSRALQTIHRCISLSRRTAGITSRRRLIDPVSRFAPSLPRPEEMTSTRARRAS